MLWVRPLMLLLCWLVGSCHVLLAAAHYGVVEGFGGGEGRGGGWHGMEEPEGLLKGATRRAGLTLSLGWWLLIALVLVLMAATGFKRGLRYHRLRSVKLTPAEWGAAIGLDEAKPSRQLWKELADGRRPFSATDGHRSAVRELAKVAFLSECREESVTALSTALRVRKGYDWLDGSPDLFLQNTFNGDIEGIVLVVERCRWDDAKDCVKLQAQCFMYLYGAHYCHLLLIRRTPSAVLDEKTIHRKPWYCERALQDLQKFRHALLHQRQPS